MIRSVLKLLLACAFASQATLAFSPTPQRSASSVTQLQAEASPSFLTKASQAITTTAVVVAASPLMAIAEEVDDYEYGAVNAPIGIAWAAGVLAVATALLPLALQGGEEAFNEMKEKDAGKWGTGNTDTLKKRR